jgi:hypothetical protein
MSSRFKALFEEAKQEEKTVVEKPKRRSVQKETGKALPAPKTVKLKGKRSNPDYTGAFAYIPANLHEEVKIKLLRRKDLDFSGLVEELLTKWLDEQK